MGTFVLGVLFGWLAEWLFYNFWVKAGDNNADCSALKKELELKNRQISSLQTQIASASDKDQSSTNKSAQKATAAVKTTTAKTATTKSNKAKSAAATTSKKPVSTKNIASKTQTSSKAKPKTAAATKKTTLTAKPKKAATSSKRRTKMTGDDFTKLSGIGPSMSATLKTLGIDTFEKLAATDDDILRDMLESSGARMNNNKDVMDTWNEQATVAAKGDFATLKKMQAALKK